MPSYDLICKDCRHEFSVFCSISNKELQHCPNCQSCNIETQFKSVNIGKSGSSSASSANTPAPSNFG